MRVRDIFVASQNDRLRLGWRLLLQFVLMLGLSALFALPILPVARHYQANTRITIAQIATFLGTVISVYLARRYFDRRSFTSLGVRPGKQAWHDLLFGFVLGGGVMFILFAIEWIAGWLQSPSLNIEQPGPVVALSALMALFYYAMVGFQEELLARGYWLQNINEVTKLSWAVLLSSLIFALGHMGNNGVNFLAILSLIAAGYLLAYGWIRSGQLWLPIGLHIGWNFFESALGFPVSGVGNFRLLNHQISGPEMMVGGAFGPESGLLSFVVMAIAALAIHLWTANRQGDRPRP